MPLPLTVKTWRPSGCGWNERTGPGIGMRSTSLFNCQSYTKVPPFCACSTMYLSLGIKRRPY